MSGSSSSPTNTTATTTNAKETNVAATNTQGVTILGNKGPVSLTCARQDVSNTSTVNISTDQGAVNAAVGLGDSAIAANTGLSESIATCGFSFANHALDVISQDQVRSASLVQNFLMQGEANLNQAEAGYLAIAQQAAETNNTQLANVSDTLANIAQAQNTSQASQNSEFLKYALLLAAGVVALYLITR